MRIATWNINSVRLRLPLIKRFARDFAPDILCLQETKCPDDAFPIEALRQMGFRDILFHGQKSYHGVAILSRAPLEEKAPIIFGGKREARHAAATLSLNGREILLHNVYVPAGGDIPDPQENDKFAHKLAFLDDMTRHFQKSGSRDAPIILLGDFNIAPMENDVWSHKQLANVVSHTATERERLARLQATRRWIDIARDRAPPEEKLYTWWSYRARDWAASDRGRRLDHIWATPNLRGALGEFEIARALRGWERASDHVPVLLTLRG